MELSVVMTSEQRPKDMMEQIYSIWERASTKNDSGKSTSIFNQYQVQDGSLGVIPRSFTTGIHVSFPSLRGGWPWKGETGMCGVDPTLTLSRSVSATHTCLHLSSKHMCLSLPHPCSHLIPLFF